MAKIDEYMRGFSQELGLQTPLKSDFPGVYTFSIDDALVSVSDKNGDITLHGTFGPIPEKKEGFYTDMLTADLFYQGTEGAVVGLNLKDNKIIVKKMIDRDVNDKEFIDAMEDFLNTIENIKERAAEFR